MKWTKFRLKTTTEAEDIVICALADAGVEGAQIEDNVPLTQEDLQQMFVDIPLTAGPDDGTAYLSFYLDEDEDVDAVLERVEEELAALRQFSDIGPCTIERSETEDKDWINNWKEFFHPFTVGDILIKPTWEALPEGAEGKTLIQIDPGTAFGTGAHETTQLCIRQIAKYLPEIRKKNPEVRVLDVGTGSGILGIAALKLGAASVFATDLDDNAVEAVGENLKSNGLSEDVFRTVCGNLIDDPEVQKACGEECYDLAAANILAPVIIALQGEISRHLKHGAIFITSGIIDTMEEKVVSAFEQNPEFELLEVNRQGEWVNVTVRRI